MKWNAEAVDHLFAAFGKLLDAKGSEAPAKSPAPKKKRMKLDPSCCVRSARKTVQAPSAQPGGPSFAGPKGK